LALIDTTASHNEIVSLLGRSPKAEYCICVVDEIGKPVVIENSPLCFDDEPMPTHYWLVGNYEIKVIGHIESENGASLAEESLPASEIAKTHRKYEEVRDALIPDDFTGARPTGGVGGTTKGVKCLHAHYANWLATGDDVVGTWTNQQLVMHGEGRDGYVVVPENERVWWRG
jgi:hypothetical protein